MKLGINAATPLILAMTAMLSTAADAPTVPKAGDKALDFTLKSQEGKTISLHDFKGQWVVLYLYPQDGTKNCTIEAHNFQRDKAEYDKLNAAIVGISVDTVDSHVQFCTKEDLHFRLLSDPTHYVINDLYVSYNTGRTPPGAYRHTFLVDPLGIIRQVYLDVQDKVETHSATVLADIKKYQAEDAKKK